MKKIVQAIITNADNEVLLQHRDSNAPTSPNVWSLWGGAAEEGENSLDALIRELHEELDIVVERDALVPFKVYGGELLKDLEFHVFHVRDMGQFVYHLQEGDGLRFFSAEEVKALDTSDTARVILGEYFS